MSSPALQQAGSFLVEKGNAFAHKAANSQMAHALGRVFTSQISSLKIDFLSIIHGLIDSSANVAHQQTDEMGKKAFHMTEEEIAKSKEEGAKDFAVLSEKVSGLFESYKDKIVNSDVAMEVLVKPTLPLLAQEIELPELVEGKLTEEQKTLAQQFMRSVEANVKAKTIHWVLEKAAPSHLEEISTKTALLVRDIGQLQNIFGVDMKEALKISNRLVPITTALDSLQSPSS